MDFKEVVGRRRSIRYFLPWRPVERLKVQTILEAARLASRAGNADFARAVGRTNPKSRSGRTGFADIDKATIC